MSTDTTTSTSATPATPKPRKPRDPNAAPLPLVIAVDSIKIPAALAEKTRKRFSAELRNQLRDAYNAYEKEITSKGGVAEKYEDWKKEEGKAISLRDFTKNFVAELMAPVIDSVMTFAEEAQSMTFAQQKRAKVKIDEFRVIALTNAIISGVVSAGAKSMVVGLEKAVEEAKTTLLNALPAFELPENTDFSGVRVAVTSALQAYGEMPFDVVGIAELVLAILPEADNDTDNDTDGDGDGDTDDGDTDTDGDNDTNGGGGDTSDDEKTDNAESGDWD